MHRTEHVNMEETNTLHLLTICQWPRIHNTDLPRGVRGHTIWGSWHGHGDPSKVHTISRPRGDAELNPVAPSRNTTTLIIK